MMLYHQRKPLTQFGVGQQDVPSLIVFQVDLTALNPEEMQLSMCALIHKCDVKRDTTAQFFFSLLL